MPRTDLVKFEWTPESHALLRQLWFDGLSLTEIGRRIGTSKHSVNNKARRLGLPGRDSPIKPRATRPKPKRIAGGSFLPPLPSEVKENSST